MAHGEVVFWIKTSDVMEIKRNSETIYMKILQNSIDIGLRGEPKPVLNIVTKEIQRRMCILAIVMMR